MSTVKKPKNPELQRAVTPTGRASYAYVITPQTDKKGKKKYQLTLLIDKSEDITGLREIVRQAKITQFGKDKEDWPTEPNFFPIKDGDKKKYIDKKTKKHKEGYANCWVVRASTNEERKPEVVNKKGDPILSTSDFYSGCYARMQIYCSYYEFEGNEGVTFYLGPVQKMKDGKPLSSAKSAKEVFGGTNAGDDEDEDTSEDTEDTDSDSDDDEGDFT